ncbi:MAG: hypothetical protein IIZ63_10780 [Caulobacteraceae bacterium]|nr:hypothetical protein [Caulobacteraceae bacterium]
MPNALKLISEFIEAPLRHSATSTALPLAATNRAQGTKMIEIVSNIRRFLFIVFSILGIIIGFVIFSASLIDLSFHKGWEMGTAGVWMGLGAMAAGGVTAMGLIRANRTS